MECRILGNWRTMCATYRLFKNNTNKFCPVLQRTIYSKIEPINKDVSNIEITVPWGKVAGKLWGNDQNRQPILALHGWQDNAASFDNLIPLIKKHGPVLALDLPGHGLSSWIPPGMMYFETVHILLISRLKKYFGWQKVKLMAHSLSAQISLCYASLYPNETQFVIAIDHIKPLSMTVSVYHKRLAKGISQFLKLEELENNPPSYKKEDLIEKWIAATNNSLDENACKILMTRGATEKSDGTFYLNRDPRVRVLPVHCGYSHNQIMEMAECVTCPYLAIKSDIEDYVEDMKYYHDIVEVLKRYSRDCQYHFIPGTHHIHLMDAQALIKVIDPFLDKYNT